MTTTVVIVRAAAEAAGSLMRCFVLSRDGGTERV